MNNVSNYGLVMDSRVNFQGKTKIARSIPKTKNLAELIKERTAKTRRQDAVQKGLKSLEEFINKFQKGEITEKEFLKIISDMLKGYEPKLSAHNQRFDSEICKEFEDIFI